MAATYIAGAGLPELVGTITRLPGIREDQFVSDTLSVPRATDCLNGTVLAERLIPQPFINFTTFWALYGNSSRPLDPTGRFLPPQSALTIYNSTRLYINLEGCVNTLRGECRDFLTTHGRDGANQTAQSRFPCFYNPVSVLRAAGGGRWWRSPR